MKEDLIGITTTVPVEIIYAAGRTPVDLNNIFVTDPDADKLVRYAEARGFPQSACAWTKGLYGAIHSRGIREVVGVAEGDCSNTRALCEILESEGITVHPFGYPPSRRRDDLTVALERFAARLGTTLDAAEETKKELDAIRAVAREVYELAAGGGVHSGDLFGALLNTSDFFGEPAKCRAELERVRDAAARSAVSAAAASPAAVSASTKTRGQYTYFPTAPAGARPFVRFSCCGVPTILSDIWDVFEAAGARFVDHEVPRQFALLDGIGRGMTETYLRYTYPYDVFARIRDVKTEADKRGVVGLVHYVQSFCHRQIEDRLWREQAGLPVLTLEADRPGRVDGRTRTRLEAFIERFVL